VVFDRPLVAEPQQCEPLFPARHPGLL
jgi:hypothetical protein